MKQFGSAVALLGMMMGGPSPATAIVGPSGEAPALAPVAVMVLQRAGRVAGFCSGIVVAPDAVLTAAHCVPAGALIKVHYPDEGSPVLRDVAEIQRHPEYHSDAVRRRERSIDLALIRLSEPLPPRFRAAQLGQGGQAHVGEAFRLAGFGIGREGDPASSGLLRVADTVARAPLSAVLLWSQDPRGRGTGACTGDSGGPVVGANDDTVVGVIAWSAGNGGRACGALTQAIWIGPQRGWIDAVLARWVKGP